MFSQSLSWILDFAKKGMRGVSCELTYQIQSNTWELGIESWRKQRNWSRRRGRGEYNEGLSNQRKWERLHLDPSENWSYLQRFHNGMIRWILNTKLEAEKRSFGERELFPSSPRDSREPHCTPLSSSSSRLLHNICLKGLLASGDAEGRCGYITE